MNHALAMEAPQVEMSALSHMTGLVDRAKDLAARLYRNAVTSVGSVEYHRVELQSRAQQRVRQEKGLKRTFMAAGLAGVIAVAGTLVKAPSALAGETEGLDLSDAASGGADLVESDTAHTQFDTVDAVDRPHTSPSGNAGFVEGNEGAIVKDAGAEKAESDTNTDSKGWLNQLQDALGDDKSKANPTDIGQFTAGSEEDKVTGRESADAIIPENPAESDKDKAAFSTTLTEYNSETPIHEGTATFAAHEAALHEGLNLTDQELGIATDRMLKELDLTYEQARQLEVGHQIQLTQEQMDRIFDGLGEDTDTDTDEEDDESNADKTEDERRAEYERRKLEGDEGANDSTGDFRYLQERDKLENRDSELPIGAAATTPVSPSPSAAVVLPNATPASAKPSAIETGFDAMWQPWMLPAAIAAAGITAVGYQGKKKLQGRKKWPVISPNDDYDTDDLNDLLSNKQSATVSPAPPYSKTWQARQAAARRSGIPRKNSPPAQP